MNTSNLVEDMNRLSMKKAHSLNRNGQTSDELQRSEIDQTASNNKEGAENGQKNKKSNGCPTRRRVRRLQRKGKWVCKENDESLSNGCDLCPEPTHTSEANAPAYSQASDQFKPVSGKEVPNNNTDHFNCDEEKGFVIGQEANRTLNRKQKGQKKKFSEGNRGTNVPQTPDKEEGSEFASFVAQNKSKEKSSLAESFKKKGNFLLTNGDYVRAEELYTQGLQVIGPDSFAFRQLVSVLLTNRAAARILQMKVSCALKDCLEAMENYPKHIRAYTRAASCQLSFGNFSQAESLLERASLMLSAEDKRYQDIVTQLNEVQNLKLKLEEVELKYQSGCEENMLRVLSNLHRELNCCEWVWRLIVLVAMESGNQKQTWNYFKEVKRQKKLMIFENFNEAWWLWIKIQMFWWDANPPIDKISSVANKLLKQLQSSSIGKLDTSPATYGIINPERVQSLFRLKEVNNEKTRGNRYISQKLYERAEDVYSAAIKSIECIGAPLHLWAVLYCNRGAALHAQGLYLDALRDVCVALSLDPLYSKPYLRLGQMYLELDYPSGTCGIFAKLKELNNPVTIEESRQIDLLLMEAEIKETSQTTMNAYKLMGLETHVCDIDIRKTFKKLALKVHPDKALNGFHFRLCWHEDSEDHPFVANKMKEVYQRLITQMQHLFKQLNEANAILLDPAVRRVLNEDLSTARNGYYSNRRTSTF